MLLVLGGCDRQTSAPAPVPAPMAAARAAMSAPGGQPRSANKLAYSHDLQLEMPAASVKPRYDRAVDRCLADAALNCIVLNTSFNTGEQSDQLRAARPSGTLTVRLPHDAVAPFEESLLAALPGDAAGDAILRSSSTVADDLTNAIADIEQRQAQLTDYRDRLTELAKRPDVNVEDLIKIESEISSTQSELESLAAQKKTLDRRVDTESLTISFAPREEGGTWVAPIDAAWREASRVFGESAALALRFVVAALPWLPIVALGVFLVRLIFRRWRRVR